MSDVNAAPIDPRSCACNSSRPRVLNAAFAFVLVGIFCCHAGCAVLTKSQVAAVGQFAGASKAYTDLPGAVVDDYADIHRTRQLFTASTLTDGPTAKEELELALKTRKDLGALATRANAAIDILGDYSDLLQQLTSDAYSKQLSTSAEALAKSLDAGVAAYNDQYKTSLPSIGGIVAGVLRGAGGIYIKQQQSIALRTAVTDADCIIAEMTLCVEQLLHTPVHSSCSPENAFTNVPSTSTVTASPIGNRSAAIRWM